MQYFLNICSLNILSKSKLYPNRRIIMITIVVGITNLIYPKVLLQKNPFTQDFLCLKAVTLLKITVIFCNYLKKIRGYIIERYRNNKFIYLVYSLIY